MVIDAVGMEAHRLKPVAHLAHRITGLCGALLSAAFLEKAAVDWLNALHCAIDISCRIRCRVCASRHWNVANGSLLESDFREVVESVRFPARCRANSSIPTCGPLRTWWPRPWPASDRSPGRCRSSRSHGSTSTRGDHRTRPQTWSAKNEDACRPRRAPSSGSVSGLGGVVHQDRYLHPVAEAELAEQP